MVTIKNLLAGQTFAVRHPVLRTGKPLESCHFEGDSLASTRHFGAYVDKNLVGVVSVYLNKNATFNTDKQYQIRGMAVLPGYQKKGIGEALVKAAERYATSEAAGLIWFNARVSAVGFYEKMQYKKTGVAFEIGDIGPHYLMYKEPGVCAYD